MGVLELIQQLLAGKLDVGIFDNFGGIGIEIQLKILKKNESETGKMPKMGKM
jgi:hypothetical protein